MPTLNMAINHIQRENLFLNGLTIQRNLTKAYTNLIHNHSETISNTKKMKDCLKSQNWSLSEVETTY